MTLVSTYDAKAKLSSLIDTVLLHGQEVVITRQGKPMVRLVKVEDPSWTPEWGPLEPALQCHAPRGEDTEPVYPP